MNQNESTQKPLSRYQVPALVIGLVGLVAAGIGFFIQPAQFFPSYLFGYIFWLQLALGGLALLLIHHVAGGGWSFISRRVLEAMAATLPLLIVLFLPLLLGLPFLYEWARPDVMAHDELLQHKAPYLNVPFFIIRAAVYFLIWTGIALLLRRWSAELDRTANRDQAYRTRVFSAPAIGALALTVTFASIDWMMSLEPHWFSSIYGVMFIVGMAAAAFSFAILVLNWLADTRPLSEMITPGHFADLGNFLLASVMLWAYIALSQYLIIWSGNLPEETPWYIRRSAGGWGLVSILLVVFHFAVPFLVLLSRTVKRRRQALAIVAGLVLVTRVVDLFWLIVPPFHPTGFYLHWLDLATLVGVGGLWLAAFIWLLGRLPVVPLYDIRVEEDLAKNGRREAHSH